MRIGNISLAAGIALTALLPAAASAQYYGPGYAAAGAYRGGYVGGVGGGAVGAAGDFGYAAVSAYPPPPPWVTLDDEPTYWGFGRTWRRRSYDPYYQGPYGLDLYGGRWPVYDRPCCDRVPEAMAGYGGYYGGYPPPYPGAVPVEDTVMDVGLPPGYRYPRWHDVNGQSVIVDRQSGRTVLGAP